LARGVPRHSLICRGAGSSRAAAFCEPLCPTRKRDRPLQFIARTLEKILFASRWLLVPLYIALALSLVVMAAKAVWAFAEAVPHVGDASEAEVILQVLGLIDFTLTSSLIVIVIISGYENFVSKIDDAEHKNWPEWMGKVDFIGLKLKLMSSIVAISAIQLLRGFMSVKETSDRELAWYVGIHLVFVVSALLLALTDRYSAEEHSSKES
jgi:uncharacterized protein (TIGR00645 family)